jgi:ATP-dependent Clp protease protease subunit
MEGLYRSRTRIPEDWYPVSVGLKGERHRFVTAATALEFGIIDRIRESSSKSPPTPMKLKLEAPRGLELPPDLELPTLKTPHSQGDQSDSSSHLTQHQRTLVYVGGIRHSTVQEIVPRLLYLEMIDSSAPIDIYLTTTGGIFDDAFALIDTMHSIKAPVNVHATGYCTSAGSTLLIGATGERTAGLFTILSVHFNLGERPPNKMYSGEQCDIARMEGLWRARTRIPEDWYPVSVGEKGDRHRFVTASTALEFGIVDRVRESPSRSPPTPLKREVTRQLELAPEPELSTPALPPLHSPLTPHSP